MVTKEKNGSPRRRPPAGRKPQATNKPQATKPPQRQRRRPESREIVYTQPKPFQRRIFFLRLATVLAVVIAIVFGLSIFFKVENVNVSGASRYTAWDVREAAGIRNGEQLLSMSKAQISGSIISKLPYVGSVRVGIKLPNTVNIEIVEIEREEIYAILDQDDTWWLMSGEGRILQKSTSAAVAEYTKIEGVRIATPQIGSDAAAWQSAPADANEPTKEPAATQEPTQAPEATQAAGSEQQKLDMALLVAKELENNNIKDKVVSVNVKELNQLEFWYSHRYQVKLGDGSALAYKVNMVVAAVKQMKEYESGVLDVSFSIKDNMVVYTTFEEAKN